MTLFKKFTIVFTLFFLVMLASVLAIGFRDSIEYIEEELYTKAQNTASTLAVSMSQSGGDVTKMSTIADAVFDTGYYRSILLKDMRGGLLFEKSRKTQSDVPMWFAEMVHLSPATAYAQVSDGWHPLGILGVTSDTSVSMDYLYTLFKKVVIVFLVATAIGMLIIVLILRSVLRPIESMEKQAREVLENRFIRNEQLPDTVELRRMTEAMNRLVDRMAIMHEKLTEQISKNRQLEYIDALTGVFNRRYFSVHFNECLHSQDQRASGSIVGIRLCRSDEANQIIGYDRVNELFRRVTERVARIFGQEEEAFVCRISGMELAIVLPGRGGDEAQTLAEDALNEARTVIDEVPPVSEILYTAMGIVFYGEESTLEKTMATLDLALNAAMGQNKDTVHRILFENRLPTKKTEWRAMIVQAMENERLVPVLTDIYIEKMGEVTAKLLFDIQESSDRTIPYRIYAPMLWQLGLFGDYAVYAFEYLLEHDKPECRRICMELPLAYLDTTHDFERMIAYVDRLKKVGKDFMVELGQNELIRRGPNVVETIVHELRERDIPVGIARFDGDERMVEMMRIVTPIYVKMHVAQLIDMGENFRESLAMLLGSLGTKLLVVGVSSPQELERLERLGIDFIVV